LADVCNYCNEKKLPYGEKLPGSRQKDQEQSLGPPPEQIQSNNHDIPPFSTDLSLHSIRNSLSSIATLDGDQPLDQALVPWIPRTEQVGQPEGLTSTINPEEEGLEETLDPSPNVPESEELPFLHYALPPSKGEFEEPHQPLGASQYWKGKMDQNSQWEGLVVPSDVIKRRYDINWKEPLGRGTFGLVLEVITPQDHRKLMVLGD
jgi:hypothetical protein